MDAPAALIETAFLSNRSDARLLNERPRGFVQVIADPVEQYFELPGK
jgi:N-acetylmuramoyl-L-alanine amidase